MTVYVGLLRAVNVGGTGKLPMVTLRAICEDAGFTGVATYIASGNVVFESKEASANVKSALEKRLRDYAGKPVCVMIRTAAEMAAILKGNPFATVEANRTVAIFLDMTPPANGLEAISGRVDEETALGVREIYVHYPRGQGRSKLRIPAAAAGTARNMNTVAKLAEMAVRY